MPLANQIRRSTLSLIGHHLFPLLLAVFLSLSLIVMPVRGADRLEDMIYMNIVEPKACVRRLRSDGIVGCQSCGKKYGQVGIIHFVEVHR